MFGDVVEPSIKVGTKKWYTVPLSIITHLVVLGALIVIPLLATDMLPTPQSVMAFAAMPPPTPPPPPPPPPPSTAPPPPPPPVEVMPNPAAAPIEAPKEIRPEPPPRMMSVVGGIPAALPTAANTGASLAPPPPPPVEINVSPTAAPIEAPKEIRPEPPPRMMSVVGGIPAALPTATNTAASLAPPPPPPPAAVRVGGEIKEPKKVHNVPPTYPAIARAAKMQGMVFIEATIDKEGNVKGAKVTRSAGQLLDQAALEAVNQWKYSPTTLNGQPVEVIMTVTVNFSLQ
jgi:protein TonB